MPTVNGIEKPKANLNSDDMYCLAYNVNTALHEAGQDDLADEFTRRSFDVSSYEEMIDLSLQYVEAA